MGFLEQVKSALLYGGIGRDAYLRVKEPVAKGNHRALTYWTVLVSVFWCYCLLMSLWAEDYAMCRPAYTTALSVSIFCYLCSVFLIPRFPRAQVPVMFLFRLSLLGGGIGIAVCQWNVRSLTMFAVAIISPSIFVDTTLNSLAVHLTALVLYILLGRNVIVPDIYSWGLGNYILFSIFGLLIGNAICKDRFQRHVFEDSARESAEVQRKYAYFDQLTGLKNRRAYSEKLHLLERNPTETCTVIMVDVNGLKRMNDSFGHDAGDELIAGTAVCLRGAFGETEDIFRIGGDEFCVLLAEGEEHTEARLALLDRITAEWKGDHAEGISLSCGVAYAREDAGIQELVREADVRMYAAKREHYLRMGESDDNDLR